MADEAHDISYEYGDARCEPEPDSTHKRILTVQERICLRRKALHATRPWRHRPRLSNQEKGLMSPEALRHLRSSLRGEWGEWCAVTLSQAARPARATDSMPPCPSLIRAMRRAICAVRGQRACSCSRVATPCGPQHRQHHKRCDVSHLVVT
jgi:hypothetical protein